MNFEKGHLYHVFNQGNNRQKIFFKRENYAFFIQKIRTHLLPHADVVAWCLMPNHFHLMVVPKNATGNSNSSDDSESHAGHSSDSKSSDELLTKAIAVMLRSYTRAINIQENRTGSLFKPHTKAQCLTKTNGITPSYLNTTFGTLFHNDTPEIEYPKVCFDYIHQNPVKAKMVKNAEDWEFSSYSVCYGFKQEDELVNMSRAKDFFEF